MSAIEKFMEELAGKCRDAVQTGLWGQRIPDYTCPLIDAVIERVVEAEKDIDRVTSVLDKTDDERAVEAYRILRRINLDCVERLEEIRRANIELRELGKKWYRISQQVCELVENAELPAEGAVDG